MLLDTNACMALINGTPRDVRRRFQRAVAKEATMLVSSVVAFELWYEVARSQRKEANTQRLETFLAGPPEWTLFDEEDAREAGVVRAELEMAGRPIGAYDVLIAGQARRRGATLVTSNTREFHRVTRLKGRLGGFPPLGIMRGNKPPPTRIYARLSPLSPRAATAGEPHFATSDRPSPDCGCAVCTRRTSTSRALAG